MNAPVVIFAFNRLEPLKKVVESLKQNPECVDTDLYIFVDGARENKPGEDEKVKAVGDYASTVSGFKTVTVKKSEVNKGLAKSIIGGATEVINKYGRVIVLEDDLVPLPNFLSFMNQMLDRYECEKKVFQVSGFGIKIKKPKDYPHNAYFHYRAHSWSWATWRDRWETVDWEVKTYPELCADLKLQKAFNRGGSDLFGMLRSYMEGRNNSWYIRFNYEMHRQQKLGISPVNTLILNEGFGDNATHCTGYNRYKVEPAKEITNNFSLPSVIEPDERISRQVVFYWSIPYRIYGKLMNKLYKILGK